MARWRLTKEHYINAHRVGRQTEWERVETDRITGEEARIRYKVPLYCEIDTIVCYEGSEQRGDNGRLGPIIFEGPPTPEMEPLDDEAKQFSESYAKQWVHPIESLPGQGYNDAILTAFEKQFAALVAKLPGTIPVAESGVSREEFNALQAQLAELMAQNAELKARPERRPFGK